MKHPWTPKSRSSTRVNLRSLKSQGAGLVAMVTGTAQEASLWVSAPVNYLKCYQSIWSRKMCCQGRRLPLLNRKTVWSPNCWNVLPPSLSRSQLPATPLAVLSLRLWSTPCSRSWLRISTWDNILLPTTSSNFLFERPAILQAIVGLG